VSEMHLPDSQNGEDSRRISWVSVTPPQQNVFFRHNFEVCHIDTLASKLILSSKDIHVSDYEMC